MALGAGRPAPERGLSSPRSPFASPTVELSSRSGCSRGEVQCGRFQVSGGARGPLPAEATAARVWEAQFLPERKRLNAGGSGSGRSLLFMSGAELRGALSVVSPGVLSRHGSILPGEGETGQACQDLQVRAEPFPSPWRLCLAVGGKGLGHLSESKYTLCRGA